MNHTTPLFIAALLLATPLGAFAQETVEGRAAAERHVSYARAVSEDLGASAIAVRQIRVETTSVPVGLTTRGRQLVSTGAEVQLYDAEGNPTLKLERLKFRSAEHAALFADKAISSAANTDWVIDLRGEWIVRVSGTALTDPETMNAVLDSAWRRGPKAPAHQARVISVNGKGFVFEDRVGLRTLSRIVDTHMQDARERNENGRLIEGETLSEATYSARVGREHVSFTHSEGTRSGWIGDARGAETLESYRQTQFPKQRKGFSALVGRIMGN